MIIYKKFKSILFFSLLVTGFFTYNLKAIPFSCSVYAGIGGSSLDTYESGRLKNSINDTWSKKNSTKGAINFSLGISSNTYLPIVRNLRIEASYLKNLQSSSNNLKGLGLYYDIKSLPIIRPYFGLSLFYYNTKISFNDNSQYIKQKISQGLTSFNAGIYTSLPFFPLSLYGEYRYMTPGIFKNNLKINKEYFNYYNTKYHLSNFIIGIRYYFL